MSRVRVHNFSVSLDGFGTGEGQRLEAPFGHAGTGLHEWFFPTRTFREMQGEPGGSTGIDDAFASNWGPGIGAEIMGRNKFGPQRGPWKDEEWKGWWGEDPPFHTPVFVLTHHRRPSIEMKGGTTFHFLDASPAEALEVARESAGGLDIRLGGGPSTVREFLAADLALDQPPTFDWTGPQTATHRRRALAHALEAQPRATGGRARSGRISRAGVCDPESSRTVVNHELDVNSRSRSMLGGVGQRLLSDAV